MDLGNKNAREVSSTGISAMKTPTTQPGNELLFSHFLFGRADDDVGAFRARDRASDNDHAVISAHLENTEVLNSDAFVAHVTGHAHVFPDAAWSGAVTDGTVTTMHRGTVGHWLAGEVVFLYRALKSFTFGLADDVNKLANFKMGDCHVSRFWSGFAVSETELADEAFRGRG